MSANGSAPAGTNLVYTPLASYKDLNDATFGFSGRPGFDAVQVSREQWNADYAVAFRLRERPNEGMIVFFDAKRFPGHPIAVNRIFISM
jgi:hypothetical protein